LKKAAARVPVTSTVARICIARERAILPVELVAQPAITIGKYSETGGGAKRRTALPESSAMNQ
jgi:hypothetical protein